MQSLNRACRPEAGHVSGLEEKREVLWTGAFVKLKLSPTDQAGSYERDGVEIPYLRFRRSVPGGVVDCYLHIEDAYQRLSYVIALATVLRRAHSDGTTRLYLEFDRVSYDTPITHRFAVMDAVRGVWSETDWPFFVTPAPLRGAIVFAPPNASMAPISAESINRKPWLTQKRYKR